MGRQCYSQSVRATRVGPLEQAQLLRSGIALYGPTVQFSVCVQHVLARWSRRNFQAVASRFMDQQCHYQSVRATRAGPLEQA